jgi:hypothetical protein
MKRIVAAAAITAGLAGAASAAEFQPIGTLGMGGAGVARNMGAYAPYWNPAGLAFADKAFTMTAGGGAGLRVSDGLADNVDRLSKFTEGTPSTLDDLKNLNTASSSPQRVGEIVNLLTVIKDIETQKGTLSLNIDAAVGFQMKQLGFGLFVLTEGFARPITDLTNILPADAGGTITTADLTTLAGSAAPANTFFTAAQVTAMDTALTTAGFANAADRTNIINALADSLQNPTNTSLPPVTAAQAADTVVNVLAPALQAGGSSNINNNQTAVMVKNVAFAEVPISYGHAFQLGKDDRLGIGASLKAVRGRVYQTRVRLTENGESVKSDDIVDALRDNYEESTNVTFDLGAQWKHGDWLTVGVVGKNLTSPTFKSPQLKDQKGNFIALDGTPGTYRDPDVKLKPQARLGLAVDPWWWLTLAADVDLTENETVLSGLDYKSRHLGGGFELHALSWLKIRGGLYKNIADDEVGPVATAGFTFGIPWVLLEIDGAYGLDETKYKEKEDPKEARVQAQLTVQF